MTSFRSSLCLCLYLLAPVPLVSQYVWVHTCANEQLGLTEGRKHTLHSLYALLGNQPPGWHPRGPTKRRSPIETSFRGGNEERPQAPTALGPGRSQQSGPCSKYRHSGKVVARLICAASSSIRCFPVTHCSRSLRWPGHSRGLAPHQAHFGSFDVLPLAPTHWCRHGKMVGTQHVLVE